MTRILVTNDDGIDSLGLRTLAEVAAQDGNTVVIAAPHQERSGSSASLTALKSDGRLAVTPIKVGELDAFSVEATPAFIAFVAARGAFGDPPELVLSGINKGANTGHAVLHSGTVGAALTAATAGIPSVAVSLATQEPLHWSTAAWATEEVLSWALRRMDRTFVVNVNVPDIPIDAVKGVRVAELAPFGSVQAKIGEAGQGYVTIGFADETSKSGADTDTGLVSDGWVTLTALSAPCATGSVDLSGLERK